MYQYFLWIVSVAKNRRNGFLKHIETHWNFATFVLYLRRAQKLKWVDSQGVKAKDNGSMQETYTRIHTHAHTHTQNRAHIHTHMQTRRTSWPFVLTSQICVGVIIVRLRRTHSLFLFLCCPLTSRECSSSSSSLLSLIERAQESLPSSSSSSPVSR